MLDCVYDDVISGEEMKRGERVDREVDIYESADAVRGQSPGTEQEDTDTKRNVQTHHADCTWSRCYRVTAVFVLLLCVLLLTAVTVLWIKFDILTTGNNQLQTRYTNLTVERDQLKKERGELQRLSKLGWKYFSSSMYYIITKGKSWPASRKDCIDRGADLVIINSKEEQEFINKMWSSRRVWIGLNDRDRENEWKWVDDTQLTTRYWGSSEPNGAIKENCVIAGETSDPVRNWADYPCDYEFMCICEKTIFN